MGEKTDPVTGAMSDDHKKANAGELRAQIAGTRQEMSSTIEELHGRLNPVVLKDQALGQFHEAADTVKHELKAHFSDAKDAMKAELREAKETVRAELSEAKAAVKAEVREELAAARQKFNQELADAKAAVREATIGKVEHMVQGAQDKVRTAGTSMMDTVRENPIPAALIGVGLAWLFLGRRSGRARPAHMMDRGPRRGVDGQFEGYDAYALGTGGDDSHEGLAARGLHGVQNAATAGAHRVSELAQQAGRGVAGMASGAATTVSHLAHDAGSAVGNAAHGIGESVSHLAQGARSSIGAGASQLQQGAGNLARGAASGARRVQTRSSEVYSMNPLAVGAAVLAVGAAVGLAMPRTHVEDEWMGSASDELMDRAEHLAHDALGKVGEAAAQLGGNSGNRSGSDHAQRS